MAEVIGSRLKWLIDDRRTTQSAVAEEVGLTQPSIARLIDGSTRETGKLLEMAAFLKTTPEYLVGWTDDPGRDGEALGRPQPASTEDDSVEIDSIDLSYGMGGTYLDAPDSAIEVEKLRFTRTFLRNFTPAPPSHLFVATGHGDSMNPTIQDNDVVLVDRSDRVPKVRDKIWAMSMGGIGMIKRLRPQPDGTMILLSDNRDVPEDRATDGELFIHGRVVAIVRKV
jgi:transcriptional regulator with XRE-family HTH domain